MGLTISRTINTQEKQKIGRNDPCYCGSGKKYKKCCYFKDATEEYKPEERGGYIATLTEWVDRDERFRKIIKTKLEEILSGKKELEESDANSIIEAITFEEKIEGKTLLEYFINEYQGPEEWRMKNYSRWPKESVFGFFEVTGVSPGNAIEVVDATDRKKYVVEEKSGSYSIKNGEIMIGRIVPIDDGWMMTGAGSGVYPAQVAEAFKSMAKYTNGERISQLDYVKTMLSKPEPKPKYNVVRNQLEKIINDEKIDFNLDEFEKLIETNPKKINFREVVSKAVVNCKNRETAHKVAELIMNLYQQHPRWKKDLTKANWKMGKIVSEVIELPGVGDENGRKYNQAIWKMKNKKNFIEGLKMLAEIDITDFNKTEIARWENNVGVCLANIGEIELAKKYFKKSLLKLPDYPGAQKNLENMAKSKIIETLIQNGKSYLFSQLWKLYEKCDLSGVEREEIVTDLRIFLRYLTDNRVELTSKKMVIKFAEVLKINSLLTKPDDESLKIEKVIFWYKEEWQMSKVNWLRQVLMAMGLVFEDAGRLAVTKKGEVFAILPKESQWWKLMGGWLIETDWSKIGQRPGRWGLFMGDFRKMLQQGVGTIILGLINIEKGDKLLTITKKMGLKSLAEPFMEKEVLGKLVWFGVLDGKYQLTSFGRLWVDKIEEMMRKAVPEKIRGYGNG